MSLFLSQFHFNHLEMKSFILPAKFSMRTKPKYQQFFVAKYSQSTNNRSEIWTYIKICGYQMINTINLQTSVGRRKGEMKKYQNSEHLHFFYFLCCTTLVIWFTKDCKLIQILVHKIISKILQKKTLNPSGFIKIQKNGAFGKIHLDKAYNGNTKVLFLYITNKIFYKVINKNAFLFRCLFKLVWKENWHLRHKIKMIFIAYKYQ